MQYKIRAAKREDYDVVPELMLQAMEDIVFSFIQKQDIEEAINFLTILFKKPNNLYSYENTFVAVDEDDNVVGSVTGYNGDDFYKLREPVLELMKKQYNNDMTPEPETEGSEFYLDTVAVSPIVQGKGVGSHLLKFAVDFAKEKGFKQVGLIVDLENPGAMKLYTRLGFKQGKALDFVGGEYYHMYVD
ncbi:MULTISPECIES: GNAT family N-acetyltransferase [Myroides]|uniref:GNAT family N-acetyltransferase n=1 Tax=Myroides albus TaxID=2562892 RepID=A0A6I3LFY2_9FLAO|nr:MULTISPECIES: GNAT family N-acetyltransferase [Myroides]MTG97083.1 GNAT family N-acetyltransferase [Myroides albus]MVX34796.1 GNAT family N-acetyltransferase [Myroides sp. LoEW2-1]UVD78494.1 GNAT family N-acetyltransferase [Myroides albus]